MANNATLKQFVTLLLYHVMHNEAYIPHHCRHPQACLPLLAPRTHARQHSRCCRLDKHIGSHYLWSMSDWVWGHAVAVCHLTLGRHPSKILASVLICRKTGIGLIHMFFARRHMWARCCDVTLCLTRSLELHASYLQAIQSEQLHIHIIHFNTSLHVNNNLMR